jgi:hypothetical protein
MCRAWAILHGITQFGSIFPNFIVADKYPDVENISDSLFN